MMQELNEDKVLSALYNGVPIEKIYAPELRESYNKSAKVLNIPEIPEQPIFDESWLFPEKYKKLDLIKYFSNRIKTDEEALRIAEELDLFLKTGQENLLRYLIYLGQIIEKNNIVTGVGRGSSVSLYLLYLCKIHKVDSLKYKLNPAEFFKINK